MTARKQVSTDRCSGMKHGCTAVPGESAPVDSDRLYPCPRTEDDPRFTFGLVLDVFGMLAKHGYPSTKSGRDFVELQQALFRFLYAEPAERQGLHVGDPVLLTDSNRGGLTGIIVGFASGPSYADVRLADGTHTAVERVALRVVPKVSGTNSEREGT